MGKRRNYVEGTGEMSKHATPALVMATGLEAEPLLLALSMTEIESAPFRVYDADGLRLIISGIGKAHAAMAASFMIWKHGAREIVNAGAAGAVVEGYEVGDVLHVDVVTETDRPKIAGRTPRVLKPDVLGGFKTASLATSDVPVLTVPERDAASRHADLVDMEGAAVVQACRLSGARCYLFKVISDTPGHECDSDIVRNIRLVRENFARFLADEVITRLALKQD